MRGVHAASPRTDYIPEVRLELCGDVTADTCTGAYIRVKRNVTLFFEAIALEALFEKRSKVTLGLLE